MEQRIPFSNYGVNKFKPFFGELFETEDFYYITQISHPQSRHKHMREKRDFKKVFLPDSNRMIAVVNLNYMFPIPKLLYQKLEYRNIEEHRLFHTKEEKSRYISLMRKEMKIINSMNLSVDARYLYDNKYTKPDSILARRCLNFKVLEVRAAEYSFEKTNVMN